MPAPAASRFGHGLVGRLPSSRSWPTIPDRPLIPVTKRRPTTSGGVGSLRPHVDATASRPVSRSPPLAIGGNVLVYASLDSTEPAVQAVVDVPAGAQISADMLRTVDVDVDPSVNVVGGEELGSWSARTPRSASCRGRC